MKSVEAKNKLIKNAFYLVLSIFILVLLLAGFFVISSEVVHSNNSSKSQTYYLQEMFNADGKYRQDNGGRLQHNNGQPIYVAIEDEYFNESQQTLIVSALDYIFDLVGDINQNYHYQIVEDSSEASYQSSSHITFKVSQVDGANAMATRKPSMYCFGSKGAFNNANTIVYDLEFLTQNKNRFYYTTLHELLHVFGLEDVYGTKQQTHLDTYLNVYTDERLQMITPNDYKMLVACYAADLNTIQRDKQNDYLNLLFDKIDKYSQQYYEYYCNVKSGVKPQTISMLSEMAVNEKEDESQGETISFGVNLTRGGERVETNLNEGRYSLKVYDNQNKMIDSCEGKVYEVDGQIFLQGVHLTNFKKGREIYTDMHIFTYLNQFSLYDLFNNFYSNTGKVC